MKNYTKEEIISIIDRKIKEEMQHKNDYIKKNGYKHKETLLKFDNSISTLLCLISEF